MKLILQFARRRWMLCAATIILLILDVNSPLAIHTKARSSRQKSTYPLRIPPNKDFHFKILSLSQKLNFKVLSLSGVRHNQRISNKNKNEVNTKEYVDQITIKSSLRSFFYYIGNCSAIPYIAKKALRATDAHSRDWKMSLTRPRQTSSVPQAERFFIRQMQLLRKSRVWFLLF